MVAHLVSTTPPSHLPPKPQLLRVLSPVRSISRHANIKDGGESRQLNREPMAIQFARILGTSGATSLEAPEFAEFIEHARHISFEHCFNITKKKVVWTPEYAESLRAGEDKTAEQADENGVYLVGNVVGCGTTYDSLKHRVEHELYSWATIGVLGFTEGDKHNWPKMEKKTAVVIADLVGAKISRTARVVVEGRPGATIKTEEAPEVTFLASSTEALNALLLAFYRPTPRRHKIMFESFTNSANQLAFANHVAHDGYPLSSLLSVAPPEGEYTLQTCDILRVIEEQGDSVALICFEGVQSYTGQWFDMLSITQAGHAKGCLVAFDLSDAVGNVELHLHDWEVDFAFWSSSKYLSGGPGGVGGIFVHDKHKQLDRSSPLSSSKPTFLPGAQAFRPAIPPILDLAVLAGSAMVFKEVKAHLPFELSHSQVVVEEGRPALGSLRQKAIILTAYLEVLLMRLDNYVDLSELREQAIDAFQVCFAIITPAEVDERGSQLSLVFRPESAAETIYEMMRDEGVLVGKREGGVLTLAPTPLYIDGPDCFRTIVAFKRVFEDYPKREEAKEGRERALAEKRERKARREAGEASAPNSDDTDSWAGVLDDVIEDGMRRSTAVGGGGQPQRAWFNNNLVPEVESQRIYTEYETAVKQDYREVVVHGEGREGRKPRVISPQEMEYAQRMAVLKKELKGLVMGEEGTKEVVEEIAWLTRKMLVLRGGSRPDVWSIKSLKPTPRKHVVEVAEPEEAARAETRSV